MKKFLSLMLTVIMLIALASCAVQPDDKDKGDEPAQNPRVPEDKDVITFSGLVAIDNAECKLSITEVDPDNFLGYALKVQLENKSTDKTYTFSLTSAAINGVECASLFSTEVTPEKKANYDITFLTGDIEDANIKKYTDIEQKKILFPLPLTFSLKCDTMLMLLCGCGGTGRRARLRI